MRQKLYQFPKEIAHQLHLEVKKQAGRDTLMLNATSKISRSRALPGLCGKDQFDYFLAIRFLGFSFPQSVGLLRFAPNGAATI